VSLPSTSPGAEWLHRLEIHFYPQRPPYLCPQIHTHRPHKGVITVLLLFTSTPHFSRALDGLMAQGVMEDLDDSSLAAGQASSSSKSNPKGSTKRQPKDPAKPKPQTTPTGTRFQCPRCPKNFSRIENLTRHQANRKFDDVPFPLLFQPRLNIFF